MKPLRRKQQVEVTHDEETGQERVLESTQEEDILSDKGSVDTAGQRTVYFRDCGCNGPVGGRCSECGAISCTACHGRCEGGCSSPICLRHSVFVLGPNGGRLRFCRRCHESQTRSRRLRGVLRALLSPFVEFDRPHDQGT